MARFPLRTIILMFLTLAAFGWFYWNTHKAPPPRTQPPERRMPAGAQDVQVVPVTPSPSPAPAPAPAPTPAPPMERDR